MQNQWQDCSPLSLRSGGPPQVSRECVERQQRVEVNLAEFAANPQAAAVKFAVTEGPKIMKHVLNKVAERVPRVPGTPNLAQAGPDAKSKSELSVSATAKPPRPGY